MEIILNFPVSTTSFGIAENGNNPWHTGAVRKFHLLFGAARGELTIQVEDKLFNMKKGEYLFIPKGTFFKPISCKNFAHSYWFFEESKNPQFHLNVKAKALLSSGAVFAATEEAVRQKTLLTADELCKNLANAVLTQNLIYLSGEYGERAKPATRGERLCNNVLAYLNTHYAESDALQKLNTVFGYSASYVARVLRQKGYTAGDYLNRIRMQHAAALLLCTDLPVGEIAASVGVENPYYFSRLFRRYMGRSATDYRTLR